MTDDKTDDATVRVTYAELAAARSVSVAAARRLTLRHRWPKQIGNDGLTRVVVPVAFVEDAGKDIAPSLDETTIAAIAEATTVAVTDALTGVATVATALDDASIAAVAKATTVAMTDTLTDVVSVLPTLREVVTSLRAQLDAANVRADRAEECMRELQQQLQAEIVEHRRVVGLLAEQLAARRSWWPWWRR